MASKYSCRPDDKTPKHKTSAQPPNNDTTYGMPAAAFASIAKNLGFREAAKFCSGKAAPPYNVGERTLVYERKDGMVLVWDTQDRQQNLLSAQLSFLWTHRDTTTPPLDHLENPRSFLEPASGQTIYMVTLEAECLLKQLLAKIDNDPNGHIVTPMTVVQKIAADDDNLSTDAAKRFLYSLLVTQNESFDIEHKSGDPESALVAAGNLYAERLKSLPPRLTKTIGEKPNKKPSTPRVHRDWSKSRGKKNAPKHVPV